MVNSEYFVKRLEIIMDYYGLNASLFADKISVQRSSISHLLSGRNKPSLDFILKIMDVFPDVDLYWILMGKGSFPNVESKNENTIVTEKIEVAPTPILESSIEHNLFSKINVPDEEIASTKKEVNTFENKPILSNEVSIDKIVIFYSNGKFVSYCP
jgi:plasmid maintenance system antidote protein VapI